MEPVTTAIIAALTAGAASGVTEAAKKAIDDGYNGLKALINKKFGAKSNVTDAIEKLQENQNLLADQIDVTVSSFDRPEAVWPTAHTWVEDQLPWIRPTTLRVEIWEYKTFYQSLVAKPPWTTRTSPLLLAVMRIAAGFFDEVAAGFSACPGQLPSQLLACVASHGLVLTRPVFLTGPPGAKPTGLLICCRHESIAAFPLQRSARRTEESGRQETFLSKESALPASPTRGVGLD